MITCIILLLVVAATGASVREEWNEKIIGGYNTVIEDHPYQVSLHYDGNNHCGGSVLAPNYVLTAAQCVYEERPILVFEPFLNFRKNIIMDPNKMTVRVGSTMQNTGGQLLRVSNFIPHENYDYVTGFNDIAILKLNSNIVYGSGVQPISLANFQVKGREESIVTGWGSLNEYQETPHFLQSMQIPVIKNEICRQIFEFEVTKDMICAGYINSGLGVYCGDSGGPLVFNGTQIGIVSKLGGVKSKYFELLGVFTNVFSYRSWIAQKIETPVSEL